MSEEGSLGQGEADIGSVGHGGSRLFPSDELLQFQHHMAVLRSSNYALAPLVSCMGSAWGILLQSDRYRSFAGSLSLGAGIS